jgi:hypothetical protein
MAERTANLDAHWALTREQRFANCLVLCSDGKDDILHLIELPGPCLEWEWRTLDAVGCLAVVFLGILLVAPAVMYLAALHCDMESGETLNVLARRAQRWQEVEA